MGEQQANQSATIQTRPPQDVIDRAIQAVYSHRILHDAEFGMALIAPAITGEAPLFGSDAHEAMISLADLEQSTGAATVDGATASSAPQRTISSHCARSFENNSMRIQLVDQFIQHIAVFTFTRHRTQLPQIFIFQYVRSSELENNKFDLETFDLVSEYCSAFSVGASDRCR